MFTEPCFSEARGRKSVFALYGSSRWSILLAPPKSRRLSLTRLPRLCFLPVPQRPPPPPGKSSEIQSFVWKSGGKVELGVSSWVRSFSPVKVIRMCSRKQRKSARERLPSAAPSAVWFQDVQYGFCHYLSFLSNRKQIFSDKCDGCLNFFNVVV